MEILDGVVTKLRNSVEISGGGNNSVTTTTHVTIFQVDGQPVKIKSNEIVLVDENDRVTVAGKISKGVFNAYAYVNNTTGVSGNVGKGILYFFCVILPFAGLFALSLFPLVGWLFILGGIYAFYKATQVSKAVRILRAVRQS
ncbi:TPA: hypothetical protein NG682_004671 [Vibrio parahaemolyticus]|uniref:hypothetical protein n=1 Tax=Vibrio parahaemolyticus TaxID=670 RepID=UPI00111D209B|nr:hypothetical protein [Vibrio parahaemolyticus]MDF4941783.1 hypothetical protein [Vibrio parahaemolyticus]TOK32187.1 hypothetical protein CGI20_25090 [Vibrio parahaemolyticus]HCE3705881.1 hypothetical protein [Vibrio parahaemolyticus]HCG6654656.1 hypothetical protein [Vibrio parahaemolyticus]